MHLFAEDILGLKAEKSGTNDEREAAFGKVMDMVLELRAKVRLIRTGLPAIRFAMNSQQPVSR